MTLMCFYLPHGSNAGTSGDQANGLVLVGLEGVLAHGSFEQERLEFNDSLVL